jgi:hypothetical protein
MAAYDKWTDYDLDRAAAMHALGATPAEIGRALGRTCTCIETALYRRLKLSRVSARTSEMPLVDWTAENLRRLAAFVNAGSRIEEIAAEFGTTTGAIQTACSRYNVKRGTVMRACMCCQKSFFAEGRFNRLCSQCATGELACVA